MWSCWHHLNRLNFQIRLILKNHNHIILHCEATRQCLCGVYGSGDHFGSCDLEIENPPKMDQITLLLFGVIAGLFYFNIYDFLTALSEMRIQSQKNGPKKGPKKRDPEEMKGGKVRIHETFKCSEFSKNQFSPKLDDSEIATKKRKKIKSTPIYFFSVPGRSPVSVAICPIPSRFRGPPFSAISNSAHCSSLGSI